MTKDLNRCGECDGYKNMRDGSTYPIEMVACSCQPPSGKGWKPKVHGMCSKHGRIMLHEGLCHDCRDEGFKTAEEVCSPATTTEGEKGWEEEFDKEFTVISYCEGNCCGGFDAVAYNEDGRCEKLTPHDARIFNGNPMSEIKSFIRKTREEARKGMLREAIGVVEEALVEAGFFPAKEAKVLDRLRKLEKEV